MLEKNIPKQNIAKYSKMFKQIEICFLIMKIIAIVFKRKSIMIIERERKLSFNRVKQGLTN